MNKTLLVITWLARLLAALIFLQTLYFKFTGAEESVYIFSEMGMEPWGRIGSGVLELIASLLILIPRTTHLGALLGLGIISGAILSHVFVLGIEIQEDGGLLFIYALVVFFCCAFLVWMHRKKIPVLKNIS